VETPSVVEIKRNGSGEEIKDAPVTGEAQGEVKKHDEQKTEGENLENLVRRGKENIAKEKEKDSAEIVVEIGRPGLRSASMRRRHV
jgi:hypothetical protein